MLQVLAFATPNSLKVPIALEEMGLEYELRAINVRQGEQKSPEFIAINPNARVPVLIDPEGANGQPLVLTESAAILVYLAEKHGRLLPADAETRARIFEQLFFHASTLGPAFGHAGFFLKHAPEPLPVAIARFHGEARRALSVLNGVLARSEFVAGHEFSIADIAHFGWMWRREFADVDFSASPHVQRWHETVSARPAVIRAIERVNALVPQA
ncbi:glutathione S-transferase family protein [Pseudomonas gingeri]|uniref:Glutathione S-transferase N-terminal domain-containing protein n=1 Tax=Pseudomonas gingeri TaxID=117681 RepID=A0A7Y7YD60_9PSED|nr:glutathione S-transferase N-terminal domain-containing protein [Pseudomonas gingeri]NWB30337.1 glutathione S-transferase N-terminal domain-containing protein [Pseudomonas gingeri]NWC33706.1 glutathione S-transferase N-terminal domain-containing protein [Pseudomonas gingeri]NWD04354.1 glutathione S-transferase N-terminal domain-containing protein [Pseudomonas gingeri]NWD51601.1 glutathione S-transferase N-terminal domain-containing protein [Pseudomonas gingeri]NWE35297.1 glutathione S-transf